MDGAHRTAVIVSVGDELVLGQRAETNGRWIADRLACAGVLPVRMVTVGDDLERLAGAFAGAMEEGDVVVSTGGLGPTADDLTRAALARALGEELVEDAGALAEVEGFFARQGRAMPESNRLQALRPASARCLRNEVGTAPGLMVERGGRLVCALPGPPGEMRPMFGREVEPALRPVRSVRVRAVHTFGLGESQVAEMLGEMMERGRNPQVGTTASGGVVTCRVRAEGGADVEGVVARIRDLLGDVVFGEDEETLASAVVGLLRGRGETFGTVESCTGGLLGGEVTEVAGASDVYVGGFVTYSNGLKERLAGVDRGVLEREGAVSGACARAMASGGARALGCDWCAAVTGVAGPGGGTDAKPVGTVWIAVAGPGWEDVRRFRFLGGRAEVRGWSVATALALVRQGLMGRAAPVLREWPV